MPILRRGESVLLQGYAVEELTGRGIGGRGMLILTSQRIIFEKKLGLISKKTETEFSVALEKINHAWTEGLVRKTLAVELRLPSQAGLYISYPTRQSGRTMSSPLLLRSQNNVSVGQDGAESIQKRKFHLDNPDSWVAAIHETLAGTNESSVSEERVTREREVVHEVVVVKIQCAYCGNLFDQSANACPHCGGSRVSRSTPISSNRR
jgi:propanediol utilization protein